MKTSIAMTTYNGEKYLQAQLDSFAAQTHPPDELIVCDDGSTDKTLQILKEFSANSRFQVHIYSNQANIGFVKNFERAVSLCKGDIIFLSDQDDFWLKEKIEFILRIFKENDNCYLVQSDLILADERLTPQGGTVLGALRGSGRSSEKLITGCGLAFRKSIVPLFIPFPDRFSAHDTWLNEFSEALGVRHVEKNPLTLYRRHGGNVSEFSVNPTLLKKVQSGLVQHFLSPDRPGWVRRILRLREMRARIYQNETLFASVLAKDLDIKKVVQRIDLEIETQEERVKIVSKPRLSRWPMALYFFACGGYRRFSGVKSFFKDLFRRQIKF